MGRPRPWRQFAFDSRASRTIRQPRESGEPPGTRSVVAYSWARRLALDYRPSEECPGNGGSLKKDFPGPFSSSSPEWLETLGERLFLFSAHFDDRVPAYPNVRVIGVRSEPLDNSIYCTIWYDEGEEVKSVSMEALSADIWLDQWGGVPESYTGVLITCPMSKSSLIRPLRVSVGSSPCVEYTSHSLEVTSSFVRERRKPERQFTLCIKGLDFDEDISKEVAAFVEIHRILGASKFHFYVFDVHENVMKVLRLFESSNVVRWINITLPGTLPKERYARRKFLEEEIWLKRRMELIPYNHCFYENLHQSEYVLPIDIDEAIVPKKRKNWHQLLQDEKRKLGKSFEDFASYAVRNVYFFDELQPAGYREKSNDLRYLDTFRTAFVSPEGDSVKSFISTERALTVHNHYALATLDSATRRAHHFHPKDALKHHYRACDARHLDCEMLMQDVVEDKSLLRYVRGIETRAEMVIANLTLS
ncbi:uncharacterized protein LOC105693986 isoform X2 [Athalia rosae]|uniref:uncharacterized protein LOC105693986 isoform X2 n=1 Tax=Athalia rosae TaxID=37344 RepID=UPI0020348A79|nr:uncharacterized protein LOC105693986 isoform X2 [Athalia rosae]